MQIDANLRALELGAKGQALEIEANRSRNV